MSISLTTALAIGAIGGGIASGVGAASAGSAQANAATNAAQLQAQEQQNSLNEQARQFNINQQNMAPWLRTGTQSLGALSNLLGLGTPPGGGGTPGTPGMAPGMAPSALGGGFGAPTAAAGPNTLRPQPHALGAGPGITKAGMPGAISGMPGAAPGANPALGAAGGQYPLGGGGGFGSLLQGFTQPFVAPTAAQAAQTPGYQFQLQQGQQAIQNSAAAQGGLLSGNTLQALDQYSQGLASSNYQQVYNNAIQQYQQAYNIFQGNQTNEFNRLAALSGVGQTAANTLGQLGQASAQNIANINANAGAQIGSSLQNAGAARASGYAGIANAVTGGIGNASQYLMLQNLLGGGGGGFGGGGGGAGVPYNANTGMYEPGYVTQ